MRPEVVAWSREGMFKPEEVWLVGLRFGRGERVGGVMRFMLGSRSSGWAFVGWKFDGVVFRLAMLEARCAEFSAGKWALGSGSDELDRAKDGTSLLVFVLEALGVSGGDIEPDEFVDDFVMNGGGGMALRS